MESSISTLARLADIAPGEMLARIAGAPLRTVESIDAEVRWIMEDKMDSLATSVPESVAVTLTITHADDVREAAEAMRDRCAEAVEAVDDFGSAEYAATIRALPLDGSKP